ncbi:MAG: hypothetical protein AAF587_29555 [Bacteroidota bacterium]
MTTTIVPTSALQRSGYTDRKNRIQRRNKAILARINHLYNVDRLRFDDCIETVADEFYLSTATIAVIYKQR